MTSAELAKSCKVKTNSVKRLHKELGYYEKERDKEQSRVDKMKADGAEASDLKQAENVLQESTMMIPQTRQRLEAALAELQSFVSENEEDIKDTEELTLAKETLAEVEKLFK
ncbi:Tubulin-specific chaperone A [Tetrabaena socialis]|uniref:Tubulin-specific chaperone A n=1 Tax=Tetrabaena socialis TaxID=47790 RepID=A0A2J7ZQ08_9CHLO|nr:Tubulin-specific chaperone A [Tetrabaena socialis]|eukprot:PNH02349.1 Tubulin-specific chaperone A [Tetrabaena socialis]